MLIITDIIPINTGTEQRLQFMKILLRLQQAAACRHIPASVEQITGNTPLQPASTAVSPGRPDFYACRKHRALSNWRKSTPTNVPRSMMDCLVRLIQGSAGPRVPHDTSEFTKFIG